MPRKQVPVRVERGLYRSAKAYIAVVTPPGQRRPKWKALGEVGLMEARRLRDEFAVELRNGGHSTAAAGRATFAEISELWLEQQRRLVAVGELRPRTLEAYESATRLHLVPEFGTLRVRAIGPDHLVAWHARQRSSGAAAWSIKARWTALRGILGYAARGGITEVNPADLLTRRERPKSGESRVRVLSDVEMEQLLGRVAGWAYTLVALLLFAGLRISEALAVVWSEIDFDEGVIRVRYQLDRHGKRVELKTGQGRRDVVMMDALARVLRRHKVASRWSNESHFVFATRSATAISQRNATRAFERATGAAAQSKAIKEGKPYEPCGLEDVTPHVLRHTFASMLISQRRDVVFVADQLGHKDSGFTLRTYAHLFRAAREAQQARDQLEGEYGSMLGAVGE